MKLGKIEFLYLDKTKFSILGLGTTSIDYHREGWIKTIIDIIDRISNADRSYRNLVTNLILDYKSGKLPECYYHAFKSDPTHCDVLYNYQEVIIPLVQILMSM